MYSTLTPSPSPQRLGTARRSKKHVSNSVLIPTLRGFEAQHQPLIDRIYQIFPSTGKVTIVCGAGISTHAGIPDFRSEDGIRNQKFGDNHQLSGSELFESRTLLDHNKRKIFNQEMARMRIASRTAKPTSCHAMITRLCETKQLVRCYTQNIDGLQTRDREDMEDLVFELHGTNLQLKCCVCNRRPTQPSSAFDQELLSRGYAGCPTCLANPARMVGNKRNLRCSQQGELLPDILLNDQTTELWKNGKPIDQLALQDSQCHMLLVMGTRLKSKGAASLVKVLAANVHQSGGVVVYVDWYAPPPSSWANYIDLHIQMDLEEWAKGVLNALQTSTKTRIKSWVNNQVSKLVKDLQMQHKNSAIRAPQRYLGAHSTTGASTSGLVGRKKRVRFASELIITSPDAVLNPRTPLLFIVYHDVWATFDARVLIRIMMQACATRGRECVHFIANISEAGEPISLPEDWPEFYLVSIYLSSYTQFLHSKEEFSPPGPEIAKMLDYSSNLVEGVAKKATWSLAVMICAESELLLQPSLDEMSLRIRRQDGLHPITENC